MPHVPTKRERERMGLLSQRVGRSEIAAGDHIYTWRTAFAYAHHGIYVGGNKVVHFTRDEKMDSTEYPFLSSTPSSGCSSIPDCGFRKSESGVVLSCLECFLGEGSLYCFEYGASPSVFLTKFRGGTCTTAKSDPPEAVIHRAMYLLQNGFGNYDIFERNCEDFALYCKTGLVIHDQGGLGRSGQACAVISAPLAAMLSSPLKLFTSSPVGMVLATAGMYCFSRYATDIGVRADVVKVKVEDMALFHGCEGQRELVTNNERCKRELNCDQTDMPTLKRQRCS